jgi:hypothetical protein
VESDDSRKIPATVRMECLPLWGSNLFRETIYATICSNGHVVYIIYTDVFQVSVSIVEGQRKLLHAVRVATRIQDIAENVDSVHRRVVYPFQ